MQPEWLVILPQLFLAGGGFLIFCAGAFWRSRPPLLLFALAVAAVVAGGLAAAFVAPQAVDFVGMVDAGGFARFFTVLIALITVLTLFFAFEYARVRGFSGDEFYGIILFAALGMILIAGATHWVTFFLGLELLSISLYVLIAAPRDSATSNEAALKYFIMGSVASGFLTFGIAVVYAVSGKMGIAQSLGASGEAVSQTGLLLGLSLILVGVGFKVSLVPFHVWTPDVYQGAPAPVTAFLSTGSKIALFAALLRLALHASSGVWATLGPLLWVMAALTMIVGNVGALTQTHLKRLLAYSSIAHMGYLLMALLAVKQNGAQAILFYSAAYGLMDLGAFGTVAALSNGREDRDALEDYKGVGYVFPWRGALLAVCLFSLAGLPPTVGFIGKFVLFQATLEAGFVVLAIIGILTAIISVYFYLKVIVNLYMHAEAEEAAAPGGGIYADIAVGTVLLLIVGLGIVPSSLFSVITRIVAALAA